MMLPHDRQEANAPRWGERTGLELRLDCRNYRGDRPCAAGIPGFCPTACPHYAAMGHRILVIKLAALGDVIRTAALLPGLKEQWPRSQITWVSRPNGVRALANHPLIDRLCTFDMESICHLEYERFDLCLSLDKEPGPAALAMRIHAPDKRGIGLSTAGTPYPLNPACAAYFELGLDDDLKFRRNRRSYPRLIYDAVGLPYRGQTYRLYPSPEDEAHAVQRWAELGIRAGDSERRRLPREVVVGLNTGASRTFANKNWPPGKYAALAHMLIGRHGWRVALLGGPAEREQNAAIARACSGVVDTGTDHSELQFAALLRRCDVVVTGDTMGMHVAIAVGVPTVALFGPTCAQEIDLFGRGEKVPTRLPCSPCYRRHCDLTPNCMDAISVEQVLAAVERSIARACVAGRAGHPTVRGGRGGDRVPGGGACRPLPLASGGQTVHEVSA